MGLLLLVLARASMGWAWTPDRPHAELEALYTGPPSEFSTVMGWRVHLRDSAPGDGSGRPVLLMLHGFGGSLRSYEAWAVGLAATHGVIHIDLPGAGLTGADPSGDYSDERGIELLVALLTQRGVARAAEVRLLLWGEQDQMIPIANAQEYLKALPNAKLVALPGVGHVPQEEKAAAGLAALQAFLGAAP